MLVIRDKVIGGPAHGQYFKSDPACRYLAVPVLPEPTISAVSPSNASMEISLYRYQLYEINSSRSEDSISVWIPYAVAERYGHAYIMACAILGAENVEPDSFGDDRFPIR